MIYQNKRLQGGQEKMMLICSKLDVHFYTDGETSCWSQNISSHHEMLVWVGEAANVHVLTSLLWKHTSFMAHLLIYGHIKIWGNLLSFQRAGGESGTFSQSSLLIRSLLYTHHCFLSSSMLLMFPHKSGKKWTNLNLISCLIWNPEFTTVIWDILCSCATSYIMCSGSGWIPTLTPTLTNGMLRNLIGISALFLFIIPLQYWAQIWR